MVDTGNTRKGLIRRLAEFALEFDVRRAVDEQQAVNTALPDYADGACKLGVLYYSQGRLEDAVAAFQHAITLDSGCADAHRNLGQIYVVQERYEQAWEHARLADAAGDSELLDMLGRYDLTRSVGRDRE